MRKEPIKVEMNKGVNPELEERKEQTSLEFLQEMMNNIENRKTQILAEIKHARDVLKILELDRKQTLKLYRNEQLRKGRKR